MTTVVLRLPLCCIQIMTFSIVLFLTVLPTIMWCVSMTRAVMKNSGMTGGDYDRYGYQ